MVLQRFHLMTDRKRHQTLFKSLGPRIGMPEGKAKDMPPVAADAARDRKSLKAGILRKKVPKFLESSRRRGL